MKTIIATLAIAASIGVAHAEKPIFCVDACTGRFCTLADGTTFKCIGVPLPSPACIKNHLKGVRIIRGGDSAAVCGPHMEKKKS